MCQFLAVPGISQGIGDAGGAFQRERRWQGTFLCGIDFQIFAFDQFHHKVMDIAGDPGIDRLYDIGMVQGCGSFGFAEKSINECFITCHLVGKNF